MLRPLKCFPQYRKLCHGKNVNVIVSMSILSGAYEIYYCLRGSEVNLYGISDQKYSKLSEDLYGT
jgi:hypothetical protein